MLLHKAVQRGLLGAVALVMDRGAVRRPDRRIGLPACGPSWAYRSSPSCFCTSSRPSGCGCRRRFTGERPGPHANGLSSSYRRLSSALKNPRATGFLPNSVALSWVVRRGVGTHPLRAIKVVLSVVEFAIHELVLQAPASTARTASRAAA